MSCWRTRLFCCRCGTTGGKCHGQQGEGGLSRAAASTRDHRRSCSNASNDSAHHDLASVVVCAFPRGTQQPRGRTGARRSSFRQWKRIASLVAWAVAWPGLANCRRDPRSRAHCDSPLKIPGATSSTSSSACRAGCAEYSSCRSSQRGLCPFRPCARQSPCAARSLPHGTLSSRRQVRGRYLMPGSLIAMPCLMFERLVLMSWRVLPE